MQVRSSGRGGLLRHARWRLGDDGASAIELAFIAPVLLILMLMIVQYAFYFEARQVALDAAQQGARYARQEKALNADWQAGTVRATTSYFKGLDTGALSGFGVTASSSNSNVEVTVSGNMISLVPGFGLPAVHESAGGPVECFRSYVGDGGQQCAAS